MRRRYLSATRFAIEKKISVEESKEMFRRAFVELIEYINAKKLYEFEGIREKCTVIDSKMRNNDYGKETMERLFALHRFCETFKKLSSEESTPAVLNE